MVDATSRVLRVGVNLLWLRPGEVGGTETYVRRVLHAVTAEGRAGVGSVSNVEWHLFGTSNAIDSVRPRGGTVVEHHAPSGFSDPVRRNILERTWLRRAMTNDLDVIHHPGGTVPFSSSTPTVVTIHDLQPLDDARNFSFVKRQFLRRAIPRAVERADLVLTPSDWVRRGVIDRFGRADGSVRTVSAYAEAPAVTSDDAAPSTSTAGVVIDIMAAGPFALYPAMTMRHKNHKTLFRAFSIAQDARSDLQLVCVGAEGRHHAEIVARAGLTSDRIHVLGHVRRHELDVLMHRAEVIVFPSRYEGFGLPVLEAQRFGRPVVASTAGALPEVAGAGALLIAPDDVDGWAEVLADPPVGARSDALVRAGMANVERYSIEGTAAQQLGAYRQLSQ